MLICAIIWIIKQSQVVMLIKCVNEQPQQYIDSVSARILSKIKLPTLDTNSVFTSRSVIKTIHQHQSVNNIQETDNIKKQLIQRRRAIQFKSCPRSQRTITSSSKKLKQYCHYDKIKFKLKKRVVTQPRQKDESTYKEQSISTCNSKLQIIQRILQLTQQLGANRADYKNYMKTHRPQKKYFTQNSEDKFTSLSQMRQQNLHKTQPLHQSVNFSSKKHNLKSNTEASRQQISQRSQSNYTFNVMKCNIKNIKIRSRPTNYKRLPTMRKPEVNNQQQMNKSIRGWTKYGKISQQIYH